MMIRTNQPKWFAYWLRSEGFPKQTTQYFCMETRVGHKKMKEDCLFDEDEMKCFRRLLLIAFSDYITNEVVRNS